jgi:hypothetical protein
VPQQNSESLSQPPPDAADAEERTLEEVMSEMSRRAQERGLTPEKLQEILNDDA